MGAALPQHTHTYQNHTLDSTRWDGFTFRDDDIVIATPYKSGTTWMQCIVGSLILPGVACPQMASPWLDGRLLPLADVTERLERQTHRRFIKTHVPLDGLRFDPLAKYIVVSRDPRDVFMSLWNHYSNYTSEAYARLNDSDGRLGPPLPPCPSDIREFWHSWITRGWFDWEREGYPHWSNLRHVATWWEYRRLPNILFVHYNHLLERPAVEIERVARYLDIPISAERLAHVLYAASFDVMRARAIAREQAAGGGQRVFKGGRRTFYFRGTNDRWKAVLTQEDLEMYERTAEVEVPADCRDWLERGIF